MVGANSGDKPKPSNTLKFLCSYGGKILPRYPDGKLRYLGGETRVLAVPRSISFSELQKKLTDLYGSPVSLRCQLPAEDLDALISIKSDEDLANLIEEYDRAVSLKIRAFLFPPRPTPKPANPASPPASSASSSLSPRSPPPAHRYSRPPPPPPHHAAALRKTSSGKVPYCAYHHHGGGYGNPSNIHLIHNGNHWQ